jgi:hypothetical protein
MNQQILEKAEGKLNIKALPAVSNPGAVIAEIKTAFAQIGAEAEQADTLQRSAPGKPDNGFRQSTVTTVRYGTAA